MELNTEHIIKWMDAFNQDLQDNKEDLTLLDQVLGDGDHGVNMARGFTEVVKKLDSRTYESVSDVLKDISITVISKVGGAAGPLYGTAFLKMSLALKGKSTIDEMTFIESLEAGLEGIKQRGKSHEGEKTLIDVWAPVVETMKKDKGLNASNILDTAKNSMKDTKDIKATKGRAAYFKEKSLGEIDPGVASSYYLFVSLASTIKEGNE